jgi:hypothetical protein
MTVEIELEDHEAERLLNVLNENVQATGATDAVRWTNAAASRIDQVREEIEAQVN